ncbi:MAG: hypothetical protein KA436_10845 [Oligoflexales bacterium]|nr:hypothetical protein [Oligoflexales bacterium]
MFKKRILNVISTAYRATVEEQDDTVVWLSHVLKSHGAQIDLLLRGKTVNYAVKSQDASGLVFGTWVQTQPCRLADDLKSFIDKGSSVFFIEEDAALLGLEPRDLINGPKGLSERELAKLFQTYDFVWTW